MALLLQLLGSRGRLALVVAWTHAAATPSTLRAAGLPMRQRGRFPITLNRSIFGQVFIIHLQSTTEVSEKAALPGLGQPSRPLRATKAYLLACREGRGAFFARALIRWRSRKSPLVVLRADGDADVFGDDLGRVVPPVRVQNDCKQAEERCQPSATQRQRTSAPPAPWL